MSLLVAFVTQAAGAVLAAGLLKRRSLDAPLWLTAVALGPALSAAALSLSFFAWRLAGGTGPSYGVLGWTLAAAGAASGLRLLSTAPAAARPRARDPVVWIGAGALAALTSAAAFLLTRQFPLGRFDAWAIWSSRARLLFLSEDLRFTFEHLRGTHPDYPWLLPGTLAAQFAMAGSPDPRIPQIAGAVFFVGTAMATAWGVMALGGRPRWALAGAALVLTTPSMVTWGLAQCADVPLAYVTVCAAVVLTLVLRQPEAPPLSLLVVGLLAGLPAWTKNEGMFLSVILVAAFALATGIRRGALGRVATLLAGAAVAPAAVLAFRARLRPITDVGHFVGGALDRAVDPERWRLVLAAFWQRLSPVSGLDGWGITWAAIAVLAAVALSDRVVRERLALRFLALATCLGWIAWVGIFLGTPHDASWQIDTGLDRLLLQLLPLTVLAVVAAASGSGGASRPATALLGTLLLVGLSACGPVANGGGASRWIEPGTASAFPKDSLGEWVVAHDWPPALDPEMKDGWMVARAGGRDEAGSLTFTVPAGERVDLIRRVRAVAAEVDEIRLELAREPAGPVTLYWAEPDQMFSSERSVQAGPWTTTAAGASATFQLAGSGGWDGTVGRLRIAFRAPRSSAHDVELHRAVAMRWQPLPTRVAEAATDAWRITMGHEVRDGLLCRPEAGREWAPPSTTRWSQLRFGFGGDRLAGQVTFRVRDSGPEGAVLWEETVGGDAGRDPEAWHDTTVPLAPAPPAVLWFECRHHAGAGASRGFAYWATPLVSSGSELPSRPNLVLVSIDTLRPDHLSLYGYERSTSPSLDLWARQAVVFEHAVTSAPWTLPAHLSMFSGLDATRHGVHHPVRVPDAVPLLAEQLRAAGYHTAAWVGGGFLSPRFGLDRGFDRYRWWPERAGEEELEDGVARALEWLDSSPPEPFFLFFHTYEVHHPYRPREPHYSRWAPDDALPRLGDLAYLSEHRDSFQLEKHWRYRDGAERRPLSDLESSRLRALYDSGIAFADDRLAALLQRLAAPPLLGRTAVVVTSDHGEALGEKGLAGHAYLEDFNSLVPLVLRLPGGGEPARVSTQVRLGDVAPTLLELAGAPVPEGLDGESLLPLARGDEVADRPASTYAAFSNRGLAVRPDRRWKLIFVDAALAPLAGRTQLFDLEVDPQEISPVSAPDRARPLRRRAQRELAAMGGAFRVHLENRSEDVLEGRLTGPAIGPLQVKAADVRSTAVERDGSQGVRWNLLPGERLTLLVQNPREARLRIEAGGREVVQLEASQLTGGWRGRRQEGRWIAGDGPGDAAIEIEWPSGLIGAADPAAGDEDLRRQLEALGYVQ